jgi:acyl carrier protein
MDVIGINDLISDLHAMADQLEVDPTDVVIMAESSMLSDLGMDSLNLIDFLAFLERKYHVKVGDDLLAEIETLGDILVALNQVAGV